MKSIGIIGSGFISQGFIDLVILKNEFLISAVLTEKDISSRIDFKHQKYLTNSLDYLIENSDIIVECSGKILFAAKSIEKILKNDIPVITMNTEFNVTLGSYFVDKGFLTEGEGDQPGCLAKLYEESLTMGFKPLVLGNIKGYLNHTPTENDMLKWSKKSNLTLNMVTSFTDGTKMQMEQAFVANACCTSILEKGLKGIETDSLENASELLAKEASKAGKVISDYVLSNKISAGVFITATHDISQKKSLEYYKMGPGPYYTFFKPYHLPHLELYKTLLRVKAGGKVLLNNTNKPKISVAAIAKRDLKIAKKIDFAIGSFDFRGEAVEISSYPNHIPIGLLENAVLTKNIKKGDLVMFDDVELEDDYGYEIWRKILRKGQFI